MSKVSRQVGILGTSSYLVAFILPLTSFSVQEALLKPAEMIASQRQPCLPGTRKQLLAEIINWATQGDAETAEKNVLWLHGMAGSGKSTVATTIARYFGSLGRQGAYLFFERATSKPDSAIRTLAYKLARFDENIDSAVNAALSANQSIIDLPLEDQFEKLLRIPLAYVAEKLTGPIIVVLDALDECGDQGSRQSLLRILATQLPTLSPIFRFLITSRAEEDIRSKFKHSDLVFSLESMVTEDEARSDIRAYITFELDSVQNRRELSKDWLTTKQVDLLVKNSEGLFIWASTICKLIDSTPVHELETLLSGTSSQGIQGLDVLYATTLERSHSWGNANFDSWKPFRSVMALVLFSPMGLNDATVDIMLGISEAASSRYILACFSALLEYSPGNTIRPLHASFRDYLTDKDRSGGRPWSLTSVDPESVLAEGCFRIMSSQLRFNICGITTSYKEDSDYFTGPNTRVAISKELKYACQHWEAHLKGAQIVDEAIIKMLETFSYHLFLFWDEVMEISGLWREARKICKEISDFIKVSCIIAI